MDTSFTEMIGIVAGCLTTASFIPQVLHIFRSRNTASISLYMYIAFVLGELLWCYYGFVHQQISIIAANLITFVLAAMILGMKIRYH
jgi:MtN3 and saliva related transmembrane protein